jgi:hypothetical protein
MVDIHMDEGATHEDDLSVCFLSAAIQIAKAKKDFIMNLTDDTSNLEKIRGKLLEKLFKLKSSKTIHARYAHSDVSLLIAYLMANEKALSREIPLHDQIVDMILKKIDAFKKWRERSTHCFGLFKGKYKEEQS